MYRSLMYGYNRMTLTISTIRIHTVTTARSFSRGCPTDDPLAAPSAPTTLNVPCHVHQNSIQTATNSEAPASRLLITAIGSTPWCWTAVWKWGQFHACCGWLHCMCGLYVPCKHNTHDRSDEPTQQNSSGGCLMQMQLMYNCSENRAAATSRVDLKGAIRCYPELSGR